MAGADDPAVVRRWRVLALRQEQPHLRADYVALARVFAEMVGPQRQHVWKTEWEGFNVQESTVIGGWRLEGSLKTARANVLDVLETRFPGVPMPEGVRSALEQTKDIQQLRDWLREAVKTASLADFERFLTTPRD
jgi:hypothetical protein